MICLRQFRVVSIVRIFLFYVVSILPPAKISQLCDHTNNNVTCDIEIANYHLKGQQLSLVTANKYKHSTFASCFIYFTAVNRFVVHLVDSSHESLMKSYHNRYLDDVT